MGEQTDAAFYKHMSKNLLLLVLLLIPDLALYQLGFIFSLGITKDIS